MELEKQQTGIIALVFLASISAGVFLASSLNSPGEQSFDRFVNYTANSENNIREVSFDNRSFDILYEDTEKAKMYLDLDQDGSFDRELQTVNNGTERTLEEVITLKNRSYRLYFRYKDHGNKTGDGYITLYRVSEVL